MEVGTENILVRQSDSLRRDHNRLQQNEVALSGDSTYLTPLCVFGIDGSDTSQSETVEKIKAALKRLTFRDGHVLVQFWSPCRKGQLLTTVDQPYGFGAEDQRLSIYRKDSECINFSIDKDLSPIARVFRRGLPEWTPDLTNYLPNYFVQQDCAVLCNLRGYLALPVFDFDSGTELCVGVLEFLMSSSCKSYGYEVQQVHRALKMENLRSPQVFEFPAMKGKYEHKPNELNKMFCIMKDVCDTHKLPLAQAWAVSPTSSFVSHENAIHKCCSSFDTRCVGKTCMSTTSLPFYVRDLDMWHFREACKVLHLDMSRGLVGRALSEHGSAYCEDVTELSEEEYPLVHYACMSGLETCFTIFLHSFESNCDFVLEFFLPRGRKDDNYVMNLVQTLKKITEVASEFKLGDTSSIQEVRPHRDVSVDIQSISLSISSNAMADNFMFQMDSSYSELFSSMEERFDTFSDAGDASVPRMVDVKVTFNDIVEEFQFSLPVILSVVKNEVAERFVLVGRELKLKYTDEENDLILICCDVDLKLALDTTFSNITINLICELD